MHVFGNMEFIKETTFRRYLNKYVKLAQIKPKSPDYKDVAERLGDTPKMVESTYYHMFPQKKE